MHALEVAKSAWNGFVSDTDKTKGPGYLRFTVWYLAVARRVLHILGPEGDSEGPLKEIETLQGLVKQEISVSESQLSY